MNRILVVAIGAVVAAGCARTPAPRYYTLDMRPSANTGVSESVVPKHDMDVVRLRPTQALARRHLLVKRTPTEIEYYAVDQWAAGLEELVEEKLESSFARGNAAESPAKPMLISGAILAFEQVDPDVEGGLPSAHIKLDLEFRWADMTHYDTPVLQRTYEICAPAEDATPAEVVKALSHGLDCLAEQILADANGL